MGLPQDYRLSVMEDTRVTLPFPAPTKQVTGKINGTKTDVMYMSFADKILITITQNGRLSQWVISRSQHSHWISDLLLIGHRAAPQ